jgi:hypothetical protein
MGNESYERYGLSLVICSSPTHYSLLITHYGF